MGLTQYSDSHKLKILFFSLFLWLGVFGFLEYRVFEIKGVGINFTNLILDGLAVVALLGIWPSISTLSLISIRRTLSLFFIFAALGDVSYSVVFYILKCDSRLPWTVPLVSGSYALAFLFAASSLILSIDQSLRFKFFFRPINLMILFLSTPIFWAFLLLPYLRSLYTKQDLLFHSFEAIAIFSSWALFNLGLAVFIASRSLFWSILSASMVSIIFGDWAMRAEKILGVPPVFGLYELHWTFGIGLAAGTCALFSKDMHFVKPFTWNSIYARLKLISLLLALFSIFFIAIGTSKGLEVFVL